MHTYHNLAEMFAHVLDWEYFQRGNQGNPHAAATKKSFCLNKLSGCVFIPFKYSHSIWAHSPVVRGGCDDSRSPCSHPSKPLLPSRCLPTPCSGSKGPFSETHDPRGSTGGFPGCPHIAKSKIFQSHQPYKNESVSQHKAVFCGNMQTKQRFWCNKSMLLVSSLQGNSCNFSLQCSNSSWYCK